MTKQTNRIAVLVPSLPRADEIIPWLEQIDSNRQYTNFGELSRKLELELANLTKAPCVVSTSSGTLGLELALDAMGIPAKGRVLLPAMTFPATASAVVRSGLTPVFSDVEKRTLCLTPDIALRALATNKLDAVLTVALHGYVHDPTEWDAFSEKTGLPALIDAAGATSYQQIGSSTPAVFSLHATKPLAIGEGGFVATTSPEFAKITRAKTNFGFESREVQYVGTNAKLSEYHAAVGLAALRNWPRWRTQRRELYEDYIDALNHPKLRSAVSLATLSSATHCLCVRLHQGVDDRFIRLLADFGVETRRWYWPPLHRHTAFSHYPRAGELEVTEQLAAQLLGLPFHLSLTRKDLVQISEALMKSVGKKA